MTEAYDVTSSSPVAHEPLKSTGQFMVIVGNAFVGGLFAVGPFKSVNDAEEWQDEMGSTDSTLVPCLDQSVTIVDRLGYPLHMKDGFRS